MTLNLFFMWSIITLTVCCNIPYFLGQYLASKAVTSRVGSPIAGGHLVTRLEKSYEIFAPRVMHTLTCIKGTDLTMGFLEYMNLVINIGTQWSISADEAVVPLEQPEEESRPRGGHNMRGGGKKGQSQLATTPCTHGRRTVS